MDASFSTPDDDPFTTKCVYWADKLVRKPFRSRGLRYQTGSLATVVFLLCAFVLASVGCGSEALGSVGAILSRDALTGAVHVRKTPTGLAAERAGMIPGDRIKMIEGVLVDRLDAAEIKRLLRGPVGSEVQLTVLRGDAVMQLKLKRSPLSSAGSLPARHQTIDSATDR